MLLDFKPCYRTAVIRNSMVLAQKQISETKQSPEANRTFCGQLSTTTKEAGICNEDKTASLVSGVGENWTAACKRIKLDYFLITFSSARTHTHNKYKDSEWIEDLKT